jgi:hypothetical protein
MHGFAVHPVGLPEGAAKSLRRCLCECHRGNVRLQDGELVAAEACNEIAIAHGVDQSPGDGLELAGLMKVVNGR